MDKTGLFGEILEQGQSVASDTKNVVKGQLTGFGKAAKSQIAPSFSQVQQSNQKIDNNSQQKTTDEKTESEKKEMLGHLYGIKDDKNRIDSKHQASKSQDIKSQEDQEKIKQLRNRLHNEYYQNLVNPPKPKEERPQEKLEREKQQEMNDLSKKEKEKPKPLAVQRAQQSTEKFRGASG